MEPMECDPSPSPSPSTSATFSNRGGGCAAAATEDAGLVRLPGDLGWGVFGWPREGVEPALPKEILSTLEGVSLVD